MRHIPGQYPNPRPRLPLGLLAIVTLVALLVIGGIILIFWREWQLFSLAYPLVADVLRFILFAAPVSLLAGYGVAGLMIITRRFADHRYIQASHVERLTLAQRSQGLPATVQSLSYHDSHKSEAIAPPMLELPAPEITIAPIPSFGQLLDQGLIGPGRPLILGYDADTGQAITGSWRDLYSCGVGALQGAGKSWLCAFLLAQSAAAGGRLIVCDPHAGADESLSTRIAALAGSFMCDVASTDDEILAALRLANEKLERRKAGKGGDWEILVAVDEWSSLLRGKLGAELPALVQNITEQGRKYHTNALLSAQGWTVDAAGIVRNRLTAHYVLRQREAEARYQLGIKAAQLPTDIRTLPDATGYLLTVRGELTKIVIPKMTNTDLARAGEMINTPAPARPTFGFNAPTTALPAITAEAGRKRGGSDPAEAASKASPTARIVSPEALRAATLFRAKTSEKAIVKELRGIDGGRNYEAAREEVRNLIIEGLLNEGVQG
jgi:hypothetical protein